MLIELDQRIYTSLKNNQKHFNFLFIQGISYITIYSYDHFGYVGFEFKTLELSMATKKLAEQKYKIKKCLWRTCEC